MSEPYAEPDKVGPLATHALQADSELRLLVLGAFRASVAQAGAAVEAFAASPTQALHDYRKALRRTRAILRLVDHELPRNDRRGIHKIIRSARVALSQARDHAVAPAALALLALGDAERAAADAVLAAAQAAAPSDDDTARLMREGLERVQAQGDALDATLPRQLEWDDIADGLASTYRAARDARASARRSRRRFHAWRRRTKELAHQLDVLAGHAGAATRVYADGFATLSQDLGEVVDLILLRDFVDTHGHGVAPDALEALRSTIDARLAERMKFSRKGARDLLDRGGKKFARRVGKAIRVDHTPATSVATD